MLLLTVLLLIQSQQSVGAPSVDTVNRKSNPLGIGTDIIGREWIEAKRSTRLTLEATQVRTGLRAGAADTVRVSGRAADTVRASVGQHVFWGALIGGAVGLSAGEISKNHSSDCQDCVPSTDAIPFIGALLGAVAGAMTGFIVWAARGS